MERLPRTRYARSGDVSVAYQVHGDGPIDLIIASGFFNHLDVIWEHSQPAEFLHRLGTFARVVRFDRRGTGLSTRAISSSPIEERMDDVRAVMDAVGTERAALYGWSEGAAICAVFAAAHPERTSALVVSDLFARIQKSDDFPYGTADSVEEDATLIAGWGTGDVIEQMAPSMADDDTFRQWFGRLQRFSVSAGDLRALMRTTYETDIRAVLPTINVPTLVLHRGHHQSLAEAEWTAAQIPGARFRHFDGRDALVYVNAQPVVAEIQEFLLGTRVAPQTDRFLATLLFTDIVGSTDRAAALGDRPWKELLEQHHQVVRRELIVHRGREIATAGDGFLATFDGPARAISCARAAAEGVRLLGLELRAGVHTGEVERHGDTLAGMAVHIGARIGAMAGPSEVLVSSTVRDLAVGSGLNFEDRGAHPLKGVPGDWQVFAVV